ncbi:MAG: HEPN domain-containing protein [Acetobacteraceae bacterium]|nr:HEPN domain-containing protein [Acetobacteraceae bacterium]
MPQNAAEWVEVAHERGRDAKVLKSNGRGPAAVYMIGYAVECCLKGYLTLLGRDVPTSGHGGHNLNGLWELSRFKRTDLHGRLRQFVQAWEPALRYEKSLPPGVDEEALYQGATRLMGYIYTRIRRGRRWGRGPGRRPQGHRS